MVDHSILVSQGRQPQRKKNEAHPPGTCNQRRMHDGKVVKTRSAAAGAATALVLAASAAAGEEEPPPIPSPAPPAKYFEMKPERFRQQTAADQQIDLAKIDHALLSAAIFHETNQRRREHDLQPLKYHAHAWKAAAMQARAMAAGQFMGHGRPGEDAQRETPMDRAKAAGLEPAFVAENVATAFPLRYESNARFYIRQEEGEQILSHEPGGPPMESRTYLQFATVLLDQWMNSPPHRKNILAKEPAYLGCACRKDQREDGMPVFFCAQIFYRPLPE